MLLGPIDQPLRSSNIQRMVAIASSGCMRPVRGSAPSPIPLPLEIRGRGPPGEGRCGPARHGAAPRGHPVARACLEVLAPSPLPLHLGFGGPAARWGRQRDLRRCGASRLGRLLRRPAASPAPLRCSPALRSGDLRGDRSAGLALTRGAWQSRSAWAPAEERRDVTGRQDATPSRGLAGLAGIATAGVARSRSAPLLPCAALRGPAGGPECRARNDTPRGSLRRGRCGSRLESWLRQSTGSSQ